MTIFFLNVQYFIELFNVRNARHLFILSGTCRKDRTLNLDSRQQ